MANNEEINNQNTNVPAEVASGNSTEVSENKPVNPLEEKRNIPLEKIPGIYRKFYSEKQLKRRLLRFIYIPQDKNFVDGLYELGTNPKYPMKFGIPQDALFTKSELAKLKSIHKDIKSHKSRVKWIPLAAVVGAIAAVIILIGMFKNPLVKKGLVAACEAAFGAKTDIEYVNLRIMSTRLTVKNIAVGNKNQEFKNLFEAGTIELDFNLVQALRGKFDAQNIEASGMRFNTDRTTSCFLPNRKDPEEENIFVKSLNKEKDAAVAAMSEEITNVLGGTDVESIVSYLESKLQSPEQAQKAIEKSTAIIEKWQEKPAQIEEEVTVFADSVQDLATLNVKNIKDVETLKAELEKIQKALDASKTLKEEVENVVEDVKADYETAEKMAKDVTASIKNDIQFARDTLTSVVGLTSSAQRIFVNGLNSLGYDILGKAYPYVKWGLDFAINQKYKAVIYQVNEYKKKISAVTSAASTKKPTSKKKRMTGTTFWYMANCPSFLIERIYAQGEGFSAEIKEITNDPNIRNLPMTLDGELVLQDIDHKANLTVDARRESSKPLISVDYRGVGFTANVDGTTIATKCGVPSLKGPTTLTLSGTAGKNQFSAGGSVAVNPVTLTSDGFPNDLVTKYYNEALGAVTDLAFGYEVSYNEENGLKMDLSGNFGQQFTNALLAAASSIGNDAKNAALDKLEEKLNSSNNEVLAKIKEFAGIEGDIDFQNMRLEDIQSTLENKVKELEQQIENTARTKVEAGTSIATSVVESQVENAKSQAKDAAQDALQSGLNSLFGNKKKKEE